ncbi:MAG: DUF4384 domain-containing protein [Myxococcota bacterium]|jgi:hypothetical protein
MRMFAALEWSAVFMMFLASPAFGADRAPDWVESYGKSSKFPESAYLTGYGMAMVGGGVGQGACMQQAGDNARSELAKVIKVGIASEFDSRETQDSKSGYSSFVSNTVRTTARIELEGLNTLTYFDEKKGACHALVYADRQKVAEHYGEKIKGLKTELDGMVSRAVAAASAGDSKAALDMYLGVLPVMNRLDEARLIAGIAGKKQLMAVPEDESRTRESVTRAIERLLEHPVTDIQGAAWKISQCLKVQIKPSDDTMVVTPFNFRDTKMGSSFSRFLRDDIVAQMGKAGGFMVVNQQADKADAAKFTLYGSYWEQADGIKVIAVLRETKTGKVRGGAEAVVPAAAIKAAGLDVKPQNFKAAYADMKAFAEGEVQGGGVTVEAWTDRGDDNLVLAKGEKLHLFVRVNQPAYIRFIYHLADKKRALLLDNYYIDSAKVNIVYQLPDEFEVDAPFGSEVMQIFASTDKFPALETVDESGYKILSGDLKSALVKTRGLKKAKQQTQVAEKRINLTTVEK